MIECVIRNCRGPLEAKSVAELEKRFYGPASWQFSDDPAHVLAAFLDDPRNVIVVEINGVLVGFYIVYGYNVGVVKKAQIIRFAVHPGLRRCCIGSRLLANSCARGALSGLDTLACFVPDDDLQAHLFLKANSWTCDKIAGQRYRFVWPKKDVYGLAAECGVTADSPHYGVVPMGNPTSI